MLFQSTPCVMASTCTYPLIPVDVGFSFKGDDGTYLCPIQKEVGFECIGFVKNKTQFCKFFVENLSNERVRLRTHDMSYLRRTSRDARSPIESKQVTPDESCVFKVFTRNGKVIFQADNGFFLSRIFSGLYSNSNTLEAVKKVADVCCEFIPEVILLTSCDN